jgi:hypothetical protein
VVRQTRGLAFGAGVSEHSEVQFVDNDGPSVMVQRSEKELRAASPERTRRLSAPAIVVAGEREQMRTARVPI